MHFSPAAVLEFGYSAVKNRAKTASFSRDFARTFSVKTAFYILCQCVFFDRACTGDAGGTLETRKDNGRSREEAIKTTEHARTSGKPQPARTPFLFFVNCLLNLV